MRRGVFFAVVMTVKVNRITSEAIDLKEIAAIISELVGRTIRRVVVSDEDYRSRLIAQGLQEHMADMFLTFFLAVVQASLPLLIRPLRA